MFVITDIYEAEKCDVSVSLSEDKKESVDLEGKVEAGVKGDESVDDKHRNCTGKEHCTLDVYWYVATARTLVQSGMQIWPTAKQLLVTAVNLVFT